MKEVEIKWALANTYTLETTLKIRHAQWSEISLFLV